MRPNHGHTYRSRIAAEDAGLALLAVLARRYRHTAAAEWARRMAEGRVELDGRPVRDDTVVRTGQHLVWRRPPWIEPATPTRFSVLYEDPALLAVDKPPGLPTLPGGGFVENTLLHLVRRHTPDAVPLHRLGRWTSGLVLFARGAGARRDLSAQWARRSVVKRYRALATGWPERERFAVDLPIGPVPYAPLGTLHAATSAGRPALSRVVVLERRPCGFLCDVQITTGRPHQIRIHLAAAGHPLTGDPLYVAGGVPDTAGRALPGDPGYALHAAELSFRHPASGDALGLICEPPPALRTARER